MQHPIQVIEADWCRLIPSKFPPIEVYARMLSPELTHVAHQLEELTNPRLAAQKRIAATQSEVTLGKLQSWNHAPFAYKDPAGTRFLPPAFGAMEVAADVTAALAWAVKRRETFLDATEQPACFLDMRLFKVPVRGSFVDLRRLPTDLDEKERWRLGKTLYDDGAEGVIFHRPGIPDADFLAVFDLACLKPSVQATHYRFAWDGRAVDVVYDYGTGEKIPREQLFAARKGRAAA